MLLLNYYTCFFHLTYVISNRKFFKPVKPHLYTGKDSACISIGRRLKVI